MAKFVDLKLSSVKFQYAKYANGRIAIMATDEGAPLCKCTVNIPETPIADDEVIIKDYSENEGVLQDMIELGIILAPRKMINTGYGCSAICKLLKTE